MASQKISFKDKPLKSIIAILCTLLRAHDHKPILTGRGCAYMYAPKQCHTNSFDIVMNEYHPDTMIALMKRAHLSFQTNRTFISKSYDFEINFLPPPLCVGDTIITQTHRMKTTHGYIDLLTITDIVRQRLSAYYRWGDSNALDEAIVLAKGKNIDLKLIEHWSRWEWASDHFELFYQRLPK